MIKSVMEVNKKVGAGAQKSGRRARAEHPNERARELATRLAADYPELRFRVGKKFMFRPPRTVVMETSGASSRWELQLLHEVGHALSGHRDFRTDPERLKMEREAWERARGLATAYNIWYDEEFVEEALDTYRDWLHQRSACSECGLTRYQTQDGQWHCPGCEI